MKSIRIVIFAKAPVAGFAKTRLIPAIEARRAASLALKLLQHSVSEAISANIGPVELCVTPNLNHFCWKDFELPSAVAWSEQGEGDLGIRLARATQRVIDQDEAILLMGTDCPMLDSSYLKLASQSLQNHKACMVPVSDGGYALLGLTHYLPSLFMDIPWSTSNVAQLTELKIRNMNWSLEKIGLLHDIDEPQDLRWLPSDWDI
jgi:hypothetical protein